MVTGETELRANFQLQGEKNREGERIKGEENKEAARVRMRMELVGLLSLEQSTVKHE